MPRPACQNRRLSPECPRQIRRAHRLPKPPGLGMMLLGGPQIQEEILVGFIFLPFILLHQQMIADYFNWL